MWFIPMTRNNPYCLGRSLAELKTELMRRVRSKLMPIAGVPEADAAAVINSVDSLERDAWAQALEFNASGVGITQASPGLHLRIGGNY